MRRNKFGSYYPPGAANDPNAPYNQSEPPECDECGGYYMEDGHEEVGAPEQNECKECGHYWEEEDAEECPECGSEDIGGLPCPNSGMTEHDYEEGVKADKAEMKMDQRRLEER